MLLLAATHCAAAQNGWPLDPEGSARATFPQGAFAGSDRVQLRLGAGTLEVAVGPGEFDLPRDALFAWIERCAKAVAAFYGTLPDPKARLLVVPTEGRGVRSGRTFGYPAAASRIELGRNTSAADLARDWVLVHELVHHAFPMMHDRHHWIEEGLATYVEPLARVQAGELSPENVWRDLVEGLPHGLPGAGDQGLDNTPTWGRIYWGGALFCLLADIEIRNRTGNTRGLQDALRAIVAEGGRISRAWPIERALRVGDQATGVPVLAELYARMKDRPVAVDLDSLWRQLGVQIAGGQVRFDEEAPLAAIRRAITAGPPPPKPRT
ncbi:MAG: hypothetical protein ACREU7_06630 [Burkholderiales bacterium]